MDNFNARRLIEFLVWTTVEEYLAVAKKPTAFDFLCMTDKVKLILPTICFSTNGSRRRSGLIAINNFDICLE